jgi:hypothetical protein
MTSTLEDMEHNACFMLEPEQHQNPKMKGQNDRAKIEKA